MSDALAEKVVAIIAAQANRPVAEIAPEMTLHALGLDSLALVELVFALEEAFGLRLPFANDADAGAGLSDVASVIAAVRDLALARMS